MGARSPSLPWLGATQPTPNRASQTHLLQAAKLVPRLSANLTSVCLHGAAWTEVPMEAGVG